MSESPCLPAPVLTDETHPAFGRFIARDESFASLIMDWEQAQRCLQRVPAETAQLVVHSHDGETDLWFAGIGDDHLVFVEVFNHGTPEKSAAAGIFPLATADSLLFALYRGGSGPEIVGLIGATATPALLLDPASDDEPLPSESYLPDYDRPFGNNDG